MLFAQICPDLRQQYCTVSISSRVLELVLTVMLTIRIRLREILAWPIVHALLLLVPRLLSNHDQSMQSYCSAKLILASKSSRVFGGILREGAIKARQKHTHHVFEFEKQGRLDGEAQS